MFIGYAIYIADKLSHPNRSAEIYTFTTMTTTTIFPTLTYLTTALSSPTLSRSLRKSRFSPRTHALYVITTIKSVSGATCKTSSSRGRTGNLGVKLDSSLLTGAVAPVSLGPSVSGEKHDGESEGFEGGDDFVFAYGLRRVLLKEREVVQEEWTKGAMYGIDEDLEDEESAFEVLGLAEGGAETGDLGGEVQGFVEEDEEKGVRVVAGKA